MKDKILLQNAAVVDGSGSEPYAADVLIADGTIARIGKLLADEETKTIDLKNRCLTPGFVDIHRHADLQALSPAFGAAELSQGILSCVSGNCGMSAAPCPPGREEALYGYLEPCLGKPPVKAGFPSFAGYADALRAEALPLNMGAFVGNGAVRIAVKGFEPGPMTKMEMDRAKASIAEAMDAGAMGLSLGLMYSPECNYTAGELTALAGVAGKHGGIVAAHIRGEGASLESSVQEVIAIAEWAAVPLHISHFKAAGRSNWGGALRRAIGLIEAARSRGQDVTCDVYPYSAGATMLLTVLPPHYIAGGMAAALETLKSPIAREKLRAELSEPHADWDNLVLDLGWDRVVISYAAHPDNRSIIGCSIAQIAAERGRDEADCLCDILISEQGRAGMVMHSMSPDDVATVLALPYSLVASDSIYPPSGNPHPRLYGAFPRVLREFVREKRVLTLPQAVRKMTSMPAERVGLKYRGLIKPGYIADLLAFWQYAPADAATYEAPAQLARGIDYAFIGGREVIHEGVIQNSKYGKFLKRQGVL